MVYPSSMFIGRGIFAGLTRDEKGRRNSSLIQKWSRRPSNSRKSDGAIAIGSSIRGPVETPDLPGVRTFGQLLDEEDKKPSFWP